ncbi:hypothetical protein IJ531_04595 [bacterium]|nr:hypothetical protein [bacterium]
MKLNSIGVYNPVSYGKNKNTRRAALLTAALIASQTPAIDAYASVPSAYYAQAQAAASVDDPRVVQYSDFYYAILSDGGKNEIIARYDAGKGGISSYYQYGNRAFDKKGNEIKNPENLYGFKKQEEKKEENSLDPRIPDKSDFYYTYLKNGDKYEIVTRYDPKKGGVGTYYQYGQRAFDKQGKEIQNPENLYGFKKEDTQTQEIKLDPRIKDKSDFYWAYLKNGDKYEIVTRYDPKRGGVGTYYQYGPHAYDKTGKEIGDPSKLYGFDKDVK